MRVACWTSSVRPTSPPGRGRAAASGDEATEEIRVQAKSGVDCVKIALDGIQRRPDGSLIAAFTEEETGAMVREIQRLGRKAVVHAIGREAVLYAARAGVDLIFHPFDLDDECIDAFLPRAPATTPPPPSPPTTT